ncbi:hypothetical protein [Natrinema versiforme]|uniref:hypothetical protein n=1 Tax=Natrinema versiforme TaxID=88724 RepID=UPI0012681E9E|nr:hypothetical protein [Natrinema versiforme]
MDSDGENEKSKDPEVGERASPLDGLESDHFLTDVDSSPLWEDLESDHLLSNIDSSPLWKDLESDHLLSNIDSSPPWEDLESDHLLSNIDSSPLWEDLESDHLLSNIDSSPPWKDLESDHLLSNIDSSPPWGDLESDHLLTDVDSSPFLNEAPLTGPTKSEFSSPRSPIRGSPDTDPSKTSVESEISSYINHVRFQFAFRQTYESLQIYGGKIDDKLLLLVGGQILNTGAVLFAGPAGLAVSATGSAMAIIAYVRRNSETNDSTDEENRTGEPEYQE